MSVSIARCLGAASIIALSTTAGWADVSPQDVWDEWKSYLSSMGYEISAQESASASALTISDFTLSMPFPDDQGTAQVQGPELVFSDNGDGTVDVAFPAEFPIVFQASDGDDEVEVALAFSHANVAATVSGSPDDMTRAYAADTVKIALQSVTADGTVLPSDVARFSVIMSGVESKTRTQVGDVRAYEQATFAESVQIDGGFDDPESDDMGTVSASMQGVGFEGVAGLPKEMNVEDMRAMLDAGFSIEGAFGYESATGTIVVNDSGETFGMESSAQGGSVAVGMNGDALIYDLAYQNIDMAITSGEIPFPLILNMAELGLSLGMPLAVSDADQDFSLGVVLRDLAVPDNLWGLVDPAAILPRDPATIVLDLTGKAKMLFDIMDPVQAAGMGDQPPGELNALTIHELLVSAAGASLSGTGDFTFDNTDLESFDGVPAPTGAADLEVKGINGLMDKLIQMGLIGDSDAMGARMMMGMLAVPGEGEDTLTSTIEFGEGGQIIANGQRIK